MRRLILVILMCLLPLQWSWAAVGSICGHESGAAHFGHHEHQHQADDAAVPDDADGGTGGTLSDSHPDCQVCHGIGAAFAPATEDSPAGWSGGAALPAYDRVLPEPPVESLLRPPLPLVA